VGPVSQITRPPFSLFALAVLLEEFLADRFEVIPQDPVQKKKKKE